jgi:hypothetical protein
VRARDWVRSLAHVGPAAQAQHFRPRARRDRRAWCRSAKRCSMASARARSRSTPPDA